MALLSGLSSHDAAVYLMTTWGIYSLALLIYRLWLSPLSRFPGSSLARVTYWYEFYYDWFRPGQYFRRINEMHQRYGIHPCPPTSLRTRLGPEGS